MVVDVQSRITKLGGLRLCAETVPMADAGLALTVRSTVQLFLSFGGCTALLVVLDVSMEFNLLI